MSSIYADHYDTYWRAGWRGPIPLPPDSKKPPPSGHTGHDGAYPSYADCYTWAEPDATYTVTRPDGTDSHIPVGNIGLRLAADIIGIDVDAYGGKPGHDTLTNRQREWGTLPASWRSTSRDDGISGITFYRIPEGLRWPGQVGPGIEVIHKGHRYAVAAPSIHPDTRKPYRWINPDGVTSTTPPAVDELPLLPQPWIEGLTHGELHTPTKKANNTEEQAAMWLAQRPHAINAMCPVMATATDSIISDLSGGAYEAMTAGTLRVVRYGEQGHHGVMKAITSIRDAYLTDVTNPKRAILDKRVANKLEAEGEFRRALVGAVNIVIANPDGPPSCNCFGQLTDAILGTHSADYAETEAETEGSPHLIPGGDFILDVPDIPPAVWGDHDTILWAQGEAFMIVGTPGAGKTTLTGQLVRALVGLEDTVLDIAVRPYDRILYLAMDRPDQIRRALRRVFTGADRATLNERLVFWKGPPPQDMAKNPQVILALAQLANADIVILDSLKDGAIGLSEDEVGAGYNRCRQTALAAGIEILELHHQVKRNASGGKPKGLEDVYGSTWLTAGAGSVLLLHAEEAGSPVVTALHLKQPANPFGPRTLVHDHDTGRTHYAEDDLTAVDIARNAHMAEGVTVNSVLSQLREVSSEWGEMKDVIARKRLQRKLDKGVRDGILRVVREGRKGRGFAVEKAWGPAESNPASNPASNPGSDGHQKTAPEETADSRSESNPGSDPGKSRLNTHLPPPLKGGGAAIVLGDNVITTVACHHCGQLGVMTNPCSECRRSGIA